MSTTKPHSRRITAKRLRAFLNGIADDLCSIQDKMTIAVTGNTFEIHLEGASINITINREGGER